MRYLITSDSYPPFYTKWYEADNNFDDKIGMIVYDLSEHKYTTNGMTWLDIEYDNL